MKHQNYRYFVESNKAGYSSTGKDVEVVNIYRIPKKPRKNSRVSIYSSTSGWIPHRQTITIKAADFIKVYADKYHVWGSVKEISEREAFIHIL